MDVPAAADDDPFEEQRERTANPIRRLFAEYGRGQAGPFSVGVAASVLARFLDLLPPLLLGIAVDAIFLDESAFGLPLVPGAWLPTDPETQFWLVVGIVLCSFLGGAGLHWVRNWGWNRFAQYVQHAVRTDTYDAMQRLNMTFFADKQTGEMMSVLSNDVNRLERFLNDGLNSAFRLGVMVVGIATLLFWMNPQLAVVALLPVPLIAVFTYRFVNTIQPKYAEVRSTVGQVNSRLENNLGGIQVIKTSNTEGYEADRVEDVSGDYFDANWDAIETRIRFFPGLRVLAGVGFALTFTIGGLWVFRGEGPWLFTGTLRPGEFVAFILYSQRFIWPMAQFGQIINMYQRAYASAARIFGLMDEDAGIDERPDAEELVVDAGRVTYDDVTFSYDDDPILEDVRFTAEGGDTLALVGPTGAGKSTALKLLLRMYDVDSGSITVDGRDVRDVTLTSLRGAIGYVSQETFLFYGTVRENITYGRFDADDEAAAAPPPAPAAPRFARYHPWGRDPVAAGRASAAPAFAPVPGASNSPTFAASHTNATPAPTAVGSARWPAKRTCASENTKNVHAYAESVSQSPRFRVHPNQLPQTNTGRAKKTLSPK